MRFFILPKKAKDDDDMARYAAALAVAAVLVIASTAILATAPMAGDFWWSDAPRNALNGAFVKDLIAAHPVDDAKAWAISYYLKYPSLTILFYPPLFYLLEAGVFSILGVSDFAAQLTVMAFILLLGAASYGVARFVLPRWSAVSVALLTIGAPSVCFWGRQVMLDVPANACIVLASFFVALYLDAGRNRDAYFAVLATLAAAYVRFTSIFIIPVFLAVVLIVKGRKVLTEPAMIGAAMLGAIGMIPAMALTWFFGRYNIQNNVGGVSASGDLPRTSVEAWTFYASSLPHEVGYVTMALAAIAVLLLVFKRIRIRRWYLWMMVGWLTFGYAFISMINHREERFAIPIMFPLAVFAVLAVHDLIPKWASAAAMTIGLGTLGYSLLFYPTPAVHGYREVADYIARTAPKDAIVLFDGFRDGNFVFNMRTHEERRDVSTIRATKLVLNVVVDRSWGVSQTNYSAEEIDSLLRRLGVGMIVYQPKFWEDLHEMALLSSAIHSPAYERVAEFKIDGDTIEGEHAIEIYRPTYPVAKPQIELQYNIGLIGDKFGGAKEATPP
jgi:hypothetical protein